MSVPYVDKNRFRNATRIHLLSWFVGLLFFFNDTATTEIYTLSLHDALPLYIVQVADRKCPCGRTLIALEGGVLARCRSEEHTSELQSRLHLVCRLLLEKKKLAFTLVPWGGLGGGFWMLGPAVSWRVRRGKRV